MNKRRRKKAIKKWSEGRVLTHRERQAMTKYFRGNPFYAAMMVFEKAMRKVIKSTVEWMKKVVVQGGGNGEPVGFWTEEEENDRSHG